MMKCPKCGKNVVYSMENPARPFCSKGCQDGDCISWLDEEYRIPHAAPEDFSDHDDHNL